MLKEKVELELENVQVEGLSIAAQQVVAFSDEVDVWIFKGEMGAGKTTFIKAICSAYDVNDNVSSPTFSIVNEYVNEEDEIFYHFDFYRIESKKEALDIGCDEYFYSGNKCFIEWPSKIQNLVPEKHIEISISVIDDITRSIKVIKHA